MPECLNLTQLPPSSHAMLASILKFQQIKLKFSLPEF